MANELKVSISGEEKILALLDQLPALVAAQGGPVDRAITQAGDLIVVRAKELAPDSKLTGSRNKQSKKSREIWSKKLRNTIRKKIVKYPKTTVAIVGPKSPEGNMAHFMQEDVRRHVLWGNENNVRTYRIQRNWITQAFDETRSEQLKVIEDVLRDEIDKVVR